MGSYMDMVEARTSSFLICFKHSLSLPRRVSLVPPSEFWTQFDSKQKEAVISVISTKEINELSKGS